MYKKREIQVRSSKCFSCSFARNFVVFFVWIFVTNAIFVPNDPLNLKKIALIILFASNLQIILRIHTEDDKIIIFFGLILTSYNIINSIVLTGEVNQNIKAGYVGYILLLYPIIKYYEVNLTKIVLASLNALAYFITIMALLDLTNLVPLYSNSLLMWFHNSGNGMIGKGNHLPIKVMYFLKASPLLLLSLTYSLSSKKIFNSFFNFFALIMSGTRANIIMCILISLYYLFMADKNRIKQLFFVLFGTISIVLIIYETQLVSFIIDMFYRKESSDLVRANTLQSIFVYWNSNSLKFFSGNGFSSVFWDIGRNSYASNVELSYWNLLRQVGLFPFFLMVGMFFYPALMLIKSSKYHFLALGYFAYLVIAYTNPLLYSSTGMLALLFVYCLYFEQIGFLLMIKKKVR